VWSFCLFFNCFHIVHPYFHINRVAVSQLSSHLKLHDLSITAARFDFTMEVMSLNRSVIELVRKRPCLYNPQSPFFNDKERRYCAWKEISNATKHPSRSTAAVVLYPFCFKSNILQFKQKRFKTMLCVKCLNVVAFLPPFLVHKQKLSIIILLFYWASCVTRRYQSSV